ncbi:hypothetical protein L1887_23731 [Cichorium endivia]|nr:hypothetical protein L1887_23731 [Cichorium endivia]
MSPTPPRPPDRSGPLSKQIHISMTSSSLSAPLAPALLVIRGNMMFFSVLEKMILRRLLWSSFLDICTKRNLHLQGRQHNSSRAY